MSLRLYSFVNFYLSSIQQGVQTGHAAVDLVRKYSKVSLTDPVNAMMVDRWADDHKTFIILNGGNMASMTSILGAAALSGYPYASFYEDSDSLGGILTCVAVVLPEKVWGAERDRAAERMAYEQGINVGPCYLYDYIDSDEKHETIKYRSNDKVHPLLHTLKSSSLAR
jgi:hypothetical protein